MSLRCLVLASILLAVLCSVPVNLPGQKQDATRPALSNQDVMDLLNAGLTPEIVMAKIKSSTCSFDTSPAALKALKTANVPDSVILVMIQVPAAPAGQVNRKMKSASSYPTIQEILERNVEALGGASAIRSFNTAYVAGTFNDQGKTGTFEMYSKAPNKKLVVRRLQGTEERYGFDGATAWGASSREPVHQLAGQESSVAVRDADFYQTLRLNQLYPKMTLVSGGQVGNRSVYLIQADAGDGSIRRMYFDVDTGLLVRDDIEYESPQGHNLSSWFFEDYRDVDGVQFAFVRRNSNGLVMNVSEARHDLPIEDSRFVPPVFSAGISVASLSPIKPAVAPTAPQAASTSFNRQIAQNAALKTQPVEAIVPVAPAASVPPAAAAQGPPNDGKIRIYVSDSESWEMVGGWSAAGYRNSDGSGGFGGGGHTAGGARPQTAEIMKTFNQRCPEYTITNNKDRANYAVILDHEGGKGLARRRNKIVVFNRDGDSIFSDSTRELGNSVKDACAAITKNLSGLR